MTESEILTNLKEQINETTTILQDTISEQKELLKMASTFRKDYDELMDAVHYLSVMYGSSQEEAAIGRLEVIYSRLQDTWGG